MRRVGTTFCFVVISRVLDHGIILIRQSSSKLNGIGTLLQPHDQPALQGPHMGETRGEPLAAPSSTPRVAAEGDDVVA